MRRNHEVRLKAEQANAKHFAAPCPKHGMSLHYTSSGRCMKCAAEVKDPKKQQDYWAANAEEINERRRAKASFSSSPTATA